jgi:hypothetical protein
MQIFTLVTTTNRLIPPLVNMHDERQIELERRFITIKYR